MNTFLSAALVIFIFWAVWYISRDM